jgi:hypothetical protein
MERAVVRKHIVSTAILIYLFIYGAIILIKPHFLYNKDGSLREFGLGFKKKTIVPAWLLAIVLGIFSYYFVLYGLTTTHIFF